MVKAGKTTWRDETVDLIDFIKHNRETLVLRPNDEYSDLHSYIGYEHDEGSWARAMREAQRSPYVVQESVKPVRTRFPADDLRASGIQRDAGGCAAAGVSRQSGGMLELRFVFRGGLFACFGYCADVHH